MSIGGTASLTANVTPAGQTVTWVSSNTSLATVDAAGTTVTVRVPSNARVGSSCTITATVGTGEDTPDRGSAGSTSSI